MSQSKAVPLQSQADYLGRKHDVSAAMCSGVVAFEPKPKLQKKISEAIAKVRAAGKLSAGDASKLTGVMQVMATGVFGWGRSGRYERPGQAPVCRYRPPTVSPPM